MTPPPYPHVMNNNGLWRASFGFLVAGILAVAEGPALIGASGLLFGPFECAGGPACMRGYDAVRWDFWGGIGLSITGVGFLLVGIVLLLRSKKWAGGTCRIFERNSQKNSALASLTVAFFISLFFLVPMVPFQVKSHSQQISGVDIVCHQIESAVSNPVFAYSGYASPSRVLFGLGNVVYGSCIVT